MLYRKAYFIVEVTKSEENPVQFPPLSICPDPPFNPLRLMELGLKTTVNSSLELQDNLKKFEGIARSLTGKELVDKAAWKIQDLVEEVTSSDYIHKNYSKKNCKFFTLASVPQPYRTMLALKISIYS